VAEYVTSSGLVVRDFRHERSLPPRDNPPNGIPPGINPPPTTSNPPGDFNPVSVGPDSSEGFGNTHVMYPAGNPPLEAQAWSGWPVNWQVPWSQSAPGSWSGQFSKTLDLVFACLDLNSSVLATMPPYVVTNEVVEKPGPLWLENPEPLIYNAWTDFAKELFWCYQAVGEVFLLVTARDPITYKPTRFFVVNPAFVDIDRVNGTPVYTLAGNDITNDVLHIKYASWPGDLHGHGPLEAAGARLLAAEVLTRYATELAARGGIPWAVLKYPRRASRAQMQQMQADWLAARRSAMGAPAVLADGAELEVVANSPKDMALSEMSAFNDSRICVVLGVPPFLMALPSGNSMTYSNVSSLFDYHWRAGLRPKAADVTANLSGWLLARGSALELDRDEYVRPGELERAQTYDILTRIGAITANDVRREERLGAPLPAPAPIPAPQEVPPQEVKP
jgi:HK97 family phage portal protein